MRRRPRGEGAAAGCAVGRAGRIHRTQHIEVRRVRAMYRKKVGKPVRSRAGPWRGGRLGECEVHTWRLYFFRDSSMGILHIAVRAIRTYDYSNIQMRFRLSQHFAQMKRVFPM